MRCIWPQCALTYNKFAGSIDALGGVPSNKIAQKAVEYVLDPRNTKRMTTTLQGENYEVAGIGLIGSAYIFCQRPKFEYYWESTR